MLIKTGSPEPAALGGTIFYTVTVTNISNVDAQNVIVTDTMPAHVTVISATPSQGSCTGTTCNLGTIEAGKAAVISYVVTVDADAPDLLTNGACVSTSTPETNLANNCDDVHIHIHQPTPTPTPPPTPRTDLTIVKTDSPDPVDLGGTLFYSVTVTNISNVDAQNVIVTDTMPAHVTVISATPSQGSCTGTTCNLGTIEAGKAAVISYVVTVDADAPDLLTNMACVSTSTPESDLSNNCDTVDTHVPHPTPTPTPPPPPTTDLTIVKSDSPDPVDLGGTLFYSVTVTNVSNEDAQNVVVTDTMPAHVTVISATPSQGSCTGTTCNLGTIGAGKAAVIAYVVTVDADAPALLTNMACVSASTPESDLSNNCDTVDTHVPQPIVFPATATPKSIPNTGGLPGSGGASGRLVLGLGIGLLLAGAFVAAVARRREDSTS